MSQHREILQLSSLCYQAEGHSHQDPLHSCKPFQEEICPDTVLNKGVWSPWCKRGSQRGILVGQPGAGGSPRSSMSLSRPLVPRNALFAPSQQQSSIYLLHTIPQMLPPLSNSKTRAHFLHVPTCWGDLQFRPPRAHPSRSLPAGSTQSRTPGLEHKCKKRFYFRTFDCSLSEGWRCVGSSCGHGTRLN